jgi:transposase-like protein
VGRLPRKRFGKHRNGLQRFRCRLCGATYTEEHEAAFRIEDYLKTPNGIMAVQLLVEGCAVRTVERITGIHGDAILRLLVAAGERCEALLEPQIQDIPAKDVEADEIWAFVGMKEKTKGRKRLQR